MAGLKTPVPKHQFLLFLKIQVCGKNFAKKQNKNKITLDKVLASGLASSPHSPQRVSCVIV